MNATSTTIERFIPTDWIVKPLKELAAFEKGRVVATQPDSGTGLIPYIGADSFGGSFTQFTTDTAATMCEPSDVLMLWDGERSGLCANRLKGAIGSTVARLRPRGGVNGRFLYYQLAQHFDWIQARRTGTGVPHVPKDLATLLYVSLPNDETEQARIALVLDTVDEAIAKTEAVIAKLRQVRAGLLHDLLTRGLDAHGQLRDPIAHPEQFQDSPLGRIPKEWSVGSVSALAFNRDAQRIPLKQSDRDTRHGIYPYYGASGIIDFVDDYLFDGSFVLIGEDGENLRSRQLPLAFIASGKFWVNNHAHIFEPLPNTDIRFLATLLDAQDYSPWLLGSAQPKLTQRNLGFVPLRIPPPSEQTQISDMLDTADSGIEAELRVLEKLCALKSGLMTDLLTGRVRVPATLDSPARNT
jgi:type I restriction enzyme S subunit